MNAPIGEGGSGGQRFAEQREHRFRRGALHLGDFLHRLALVMGFALAAPGIQPRSYAQIGEWSDRGYASSQGCREVLVHAFLLCTESDRRRERMVAFCDEPDRMEKMQPRALSFGHTGGVRSNADADRADVEKVLADDMAAFENTVRRPQSPLINLAHRFCRDRSRAEDMAQDAFLRAHRALGGWRKDAAFSRWLFALAMNLHRSENPRIPPRMISRDDIAAPADARALPAEADGETREVAVRRAVLARPPKCRDALTLYYFHGRDVAQAARSLGVREGTVKAGLNRGGEILRRKLARLLEDLGLKKDEIDRALSEEIRIVPSPGFANGVMQAAPRGASAPSPIPFPWKRALPALATGALAFLE